MEKSLFEQMGGTYTHVEDYMLPNLTLFKQQVQPIGIWGHRHARYLKQHHKIIYINLLTSGKLNSYFADINEQAENMFSSLVNQMAEKQGVTEQHKTKNQMLWVQQINNIRNAAIETVNRELIYS